MEHSISQNNILRILQAISPLLLTSICAIHIFRKKYTSKYELTPKIISVTASLKKRRWLLLLLTGIQVTGWLYNFIQYSLDPVSKQFYDSFTLAVYFINWFALFVLSFTSPSKNLYSERGYNHAFCVIYVYLSIESGYRVLKLGDDAQLWDILYCAATLLLFIIVGSTPQPYHPRDFQVSADDKLEIKEGKVYINDLLLSPESTASIFSWAAFQWMNPLVVFGFKNTVDRSNIYAMTFQHLARNAYADYVDTKKLFNGTKVLRRIFKSNKQEIAVQFVFSVAACSVSYLAPFFQQKLLRYFEQGENRGPIQTAYLYAFGMLMVAIIKLLCNSVQLWVGRRWNIRTFSMLDAEIFYKTLRRKDMLGMVSKSKENEDEESKKEDQNKDDSPSVSSVGKITNLMSQDAYHLSDVPAYIHMIYSAPIEISVALFYLYTLLGNAALVGLVVMTICFPITSKLTKRMNKNYFGYNGAKDSRNELVNEMLQGIRMIKYFAWESNWTERITDSRNKEIKSMIKLIISDVLMHIVYLIVPVLVTASTFIWYTKVAGNELTASVAFVSITLFEMLRNPLFFIPETVNTFTESYSNLKRISAYLEEPEVDENINTEPIEIPEGVSPHVVLSRVGFERSVFEWHHEKAKEAPFTDTPTDEEQGNSQSLTGSTVSNHSTDKKFQLSVPQFNFPTGKLSIVCGPTGSGKSSFLYALLSEMDIISGRVYLPSKVVLNKENISNVDPEYPDLYLNKVAYVAQQPFLQHASIRDNILFGLPFDAERYKKVLYQCALIKDLQILADGDRTEIGEKGISLSGGQKQRVSLARAVYSHAKTVLLDDCLSAVDSHTSKHIYRHCLTGNLLKGRTVILVTHQVKLCLPGANFFVKIENGNLVGCDTVERLRSTGVLAKLLGSENQEDRDNAAEDDIEEIVDDDDESSDFDLDLIGEKEAKKLIEEETSEKGQVKFRVYSTYLSACGGWFYWTLVLFSYVTCRLLTFAENWWLRIWSASYSSSAHGNSLGAMMQETPQYSIMFPNSPVAQNIVNTLQSAAQKQTVFKSWVFEEKSPVNVDYYIGIYLALCFGYIMCDVLRNVLISWGSVRGARKLFADMLNRIIHAPMRFFDTTPVGRILNRFGKDISTIDMQLARNASFLIECVSSIIISTAIISSITPQFLIVAIAVSGVYFLIGVFYLRISRELKRLNSVSRSPIYSHFTESLSGVVTIRAYGVEEEFMRTVYQKIDDYVAPFYLLWMSNRWLYARIEFTGAFVTFFTGVFLIINIDKIDAGMAGISLFYASSFLLNIYWFIRQYTSVEMDLNSVERVQEYLEIDQEPPAVIEDNRPPAAWPTDAAIDVKDLVVRYAPGLDPVLHGVSFSTGSHEKIGIVGRTGSGKSTMALSFFRFLEADSGSISIDGVDISQIGLQDLRSQITIIPQDAVLFSGTIRSNIDPFNQHSDEEVWEALDRAHISRPSDRTKHLRSGTSTPGGGSRAPTINEVEEQQSAVRSLSQKVSDGGNNFSQGQRQLLCLARALLKNSKLIIMDEATASVDFDTDAKIQRTIREEFTNSTLLCIAHRLRTVIDYDRVLVLDQGRVVEYDTPYNLITGSTGTNVFKSMCERSGELDTLIRMAAEAHESKQNNL